jgi:hypothetical protein
MKLGDLQVDKNYGAVDEPTNGRFGILPRQVRLVKIVTVPEERWGPSYTGERKMVNVRKCEVEFLDEQQEQPGSYDFRNPIRKAKKGATLIVEARQLVGAWKDLAPDVHQRVRAEQKKRDTQADLERRFKAVGFDENKHEFYVMVDNPDYPQVYFRNKALYKLLAKLEASHE